MYIKGCIKGTSYVGTKSPLSSSEIEEIIFISKLTNININENFRNVRESIDRFLEACKQDQGIIDEVIVPYKDDLCIVRIFGGYFLSGEYKDQITVLDDFIIVEQTNHHEVYIICVRETYEIKLAFAVNQGQASNEIAEFVSTIERENDLQL